QPGDLPGADQSADDALGDEQVRERTDGPEGVTEVGSHLRVPAVEGLEARGLVKVVTWLSWFLHVDHRRDSAVPRETRPEPFHVKRGGVGHECPGAAPLVPRSAMEARHIDATACTAARLPRATPLRPGS